MVVSSGAAGLMHGCMTFQLLLPSRSTSDVNKPYRLSKIRAIHRLQGPIHSLWPAITAVVAAAYEEIRGESAGHIFDTCVQAAAIVSRHAAASLGISATWKVLAVYRLIAAGIGLVRAHLARFIISRTEVPPQFVVTFLRGHNNVS